MRAQCSPAVPAAAWSPSPSPSRSSCWPSASSRARFLTTENRERDAIFTLLAREAAGDDARRPGARCTAATRPAPRRSARSCRRSPAPVRSKIARLDSGTSLHAGHQHGRVARGLGARRRQPADRAVRDASDATAGPLTGRSVSLLRTQRAAGRQRGLLLTQLSLRRTASRPCPWCSPSPRCSDAAFCCPSSPSSRCRRPPWPEPERQRRSGRRPLEQDPLQGRRLRALPDGRQWCYRADTAGNGAESVFAGDPSTVGWTPVSVPNAWNAKDYSDASFAGGVGWYRKNFHLPSAVKRARPGSCASSRSTTARGSTSTAS